MTDLLEESLEELDFLCEQRDAVVFAHDWTPADLADLEERIEAHLDALRLGGVHSAELASPLLAGSERGAAIAATLVLTALGDPALEAEAVAALAGEESPARDGVRVGLRHGAGAGSAAALGGLAARGEPLVRARAADVVAFHRMPRPQGLAELLESRDAQVRRLACGAAGRLGGPWDLRLLQDALRGGDRALQDAAFEASARLGVRGLAEALRAAAAGSAGAAALAGLGVLGAREDLPLLLAALERPELAGAALGALGALGDVRAVPALLERLADRRTAVAASRAFVRITGATGVDADEPLPPPDGMPEEERDFWEAPRVVDPGRARRWWEANGACPSAGRRWQAGVDVSDAGRRPELLDLLPLEARRDVYLSLRARDPQRIPDLELEARVKPRRT